MKKLKDWSYYKWMEVLIFLAFILCFIYTFVFDSLKTTDSRMLVIGLGMIVLMNMIKSQKPIAYIIKSLLLISAIGLTIYF